MYFSYGYIMVDESHSYEMCSDSGVIHAEAGIIISPGHPNHYTDHEDCRITLYNNLTHCVSINIFTTTNMIYNFQIFH